MVNETPITGGKAIEPPEAAKLGGLLVRLPDLVVPPRDITLADGSMRHDPGGKIARWEIPGNSPIGVTIVNGFGTTAAQDGLDAARIFDKLYAGQKRRPTITVFDYRGLGESTGIAASEISFSRMRADAAAVLKETAGPQIVFGASLGGNTALLWAQRDFEQAQRFYAPRKVLAVVALNPADITRIEDIELKSRHFMRQMRQKHGVRGITPAHAQAFVEDGRQHGLKDTLSPRNLTQKVFAAPVILIQGDKDEIVSAAYNEQLARESHGPGILFVPVKGMGHDPAKNPAALADLVTRRFMLNGKDVTLAQWLDHHLKPDRAWIATQHMRRTVLPKVVPAVREASVQGMQDLWKFGARLVTGLTQATRAALQSERAQRLRAQLKQAQASGWEKLFPPRIAHDPKPPANDDERQRRLYPPPHQSNKIG